MTESKTKATSFAVFAYVVILVMAGLSASASHALAGLAPAPINVRSSRAAAPATGMRAESLVYPPRDPAIIFDHSAHLDLGLTCSPCHPNALRSTTSRDDLGVAAASCDGCHQTGHPWVVATTQGARARLPATCETCHLFDEIPSMGRSRRQRDSATPLLTFNHSMHLRDGASCESCHAGIRTPQQGDASHAYLPTEKSCIECHDGRRAANDCRTCHPTERTGLLKLSRGTARGRAKLVPASDHAWGMGHDLNFVERHGAVASVAGEQCAQCHSEDECQSCHAGATRPLTIHRPDFVRSHGIEARTRTSDCGTCHRLQSDCLSCHERLGVGPGAGGPFTAPSAGTFHGAGWAGAPGQPQAHAQAARLNMETCVSCHQEDTCLTCHATSQHSRQGLNANPHGATYAGSARCRQLASLNRRVCLRCHAPGTPALDCVGFGAGGGLGGLAPTWRR